MTRQSSPLVVVAHVHNSKASRGGSKENIPVRTRRGLSHSPTPATKSRAFASEATSCLPSASEANDEKGIGLGWSVTQSRSEYFQSYFVHGFDASVTRLPETRPKVRIPLASLPEDVTELSEPASVPVSPQGAITIYQKMAISSREDTELARSMNERVNSHTAHLGRHICQLESLAKDFRAKVKGVAREFKELKTELSQYSESFEGLEVDYCDAVAALYEEKGTVISYIEKLRNAEVEIHQLHKCIETGSEEHLVGYSQAKTLEPLYERYA